jgi:hypothetical protein
MSTVELTSAVQKLSPEELHRFTEWFERFIESQWEKRIEEDVTQGRLDRVTKKADDDFAAGRCTPL